MPADDQPIASGWNAILNSCKVMCLYLVRKHMDGAVYKKSAILQVLVCLFQSTHFCSSANSSLVIFPEHSNSFEQTVQKSNLLARKSEQGKVMSWANNLNASVCSQWETKFSTLELYSLFLYFSFAFSIVHRSGRVVKNGEGLGMLTMCQSGIRWM